jgi:hypothetical protein
MHSNVFHFIKNYIINHFIENNFIKMQQLIKNKFGILSSKLTMEFSTNGIQNPMACWGEEGLEGDSRTDCGDLIRVMGFKN